MAAARLAAPPRAAPALPPPRSTALALVGAARHTMAAIGGKAGAMPRPQITQLEETPAAAQKSAAVIDVDFEVVRKGKTARAPKAKPRRSFFGKVKHALTLAAWAAFIGLMIPPTVVAVSLLLRQSGG